MKAHTKPDLGTLDLLELLALDESGFKHRFTGTPMLRAKRQGMLRNACVALGNVGDETALPSLQRTASEPEPVLAEHARWAMEQIQERGRLPG